MHKKYRLSMVLSRTSTLALLNGVVLLFSLCGAFLWGETPQATAATTNTINFQARLMNNVGSIVTDGYYNVEFKIYDVSSGGTALFTDTYYDSNGVTAGNDARIRVANGYLTVSLGGQGGNAFPSTINWDQDLWLTMNIGGTTQTATPTWDGEMSPRLKLNAVPYAFRAGQLASLVGTKTAVLQFATPFANDTVITLPDPGGTTATVCYQNATACGFATGTAGSYIQNTTTAQAANFNVRAATSGSVAGVLQGANGQSVDIFDVQTYNGSSSTTVFGITAAGAINHTYSSGSASNAQTLAYTNSNTGAGVAIQGINITPTNTATPSGGTNTLNVINFAAGGALGGSDTTNGINFASATGYTNFLSTPTTTLSSAGALLLAPTAAGIVPLSVNATSNVTTSAAAALFTQANSSVAALGDTLQVTSTNTANTQTNGILFNRNGTGGTTTNGLNIVNTLGTLQNGIAITQSAGTLNNGLVFGGTITNDITTAASSNRNLSLAPDGTGKVTIGGTAPTIAFANTGSAAVINFLNNGATIGNSLTITGQGASSGAGGDVTLQGGLATGAAAGGTLLLRGGAAASGGTNGTATLDAGTGASTPNGTVNLGISNASIINIGSVGSTAKNTTLHIADTTGNATQAITIGVDATGGANAVSNTLTLEAGTGASAIQIGNSGQAHGIKIGTGAAVQTIMIGSTNSTSALSLQAGTGNLNIGNDNASKTTTINIGNDNTGADIIALGSNNANSTTSIQGGNTSTGVGSISIQAATAGLITIGTTNSNPVTIGGGSSTVKIGNLGSSTSNAVAVCRDSSTTALIACDGTNSGPAFIQNGNSFNTIGVLGTNDAFNLQIETANSIRATFDQSNNLYLGNGVTHATPTNFAIQGTGSATAGATPGGSLTVKGGAGMTTSTGSAGGNVLIAGGDSVGGSGGNAGGNVTLQGGINTNAGAAGVVKVKNSVDSTTSFQVLTSGNVGILTVDTATAGGRVGIGLATTPSRSLDVSVSTSAINALPVIVQQAGAGDVGIEVKSSTKSFYVGLDASNSSAYSINSSTSATVSGGTLGFVCASPPTGCASQDSSDSGTMNALQITNGGTAAVVTSIQVFLPSGAPNTLGTAPNNKAQVAIYSDSSNTPQNLVATSKEMVISSLGAYTVFPISATLSASTKYWLVYNTNGINSTQNNMAKTTTGGVSCFKAQAYGTWPATISSPTCGGTDRFAMYANLNTVTPNTDNFNASLFSLTDTGQTIFRNFSDSTTAFQIQNAGNSSSVFNVDTTNRRIGIESTAPSYDLSFGGFANRVIGVEAQTAAATAGANLTVISGQGNTTGTGGTTTIQGGGSGTGAAALGGSVIVQGGTANGTGISNGGAASLVGGTASATGTGGTASVLGGAASTTSGSAGGAVAITGANGTATSTGGAGGAVTITGGNATSSGNNNGGSITLQAGSATGTGTIGGVLVKNAANSSTAFQIQNTIGSNVLVADTTPLNSLIDNGSMENSTNTYWANKAGTGTPTRVSTQAYIGSWSEQVVLGTGNTDGVKYTPTNTLAANTYTLSFEIKQTSGTAFGTALLVGTNNGSDNNCTLSPTLTAQPISTSGWERFTCTFTTTGTTTFIYWRQNDTPGSARTFFIDAIQLEVASSAKPFTESKLALNGVVNSPVVLQNASDSTTAFQVQNAAGTASVLDVDTINGLVGIGTATPARTLDVAVSSSAIATPQIRLSQAGSGDATLELKTASTGTSFYIGEDASNSGTLTFGSSTAASSYSTPAHVQSIGPAPSSSPATTMTQTLNTTAGNLLVAAVSWDTQGSTVMTMTCTDSQGNAYTNLTLREDTSPNHQALQVCYAPNIVGGASNTVTASFFNGSTPTAVPFRKMTVSEYSGIAAVNPTDGTTGQYVVTASTSADAVTSGSFNTTQDGDLIYAAVVDTTGSNNISAGSGFSTNYYELPATSANEIAKEDKIQSAAGSTAGTFTFNATNSYVITAVAFKAATNGMTDTFTNSLFTLSQTGAAKFKNSSNSSTAFQVQNAASVNLIGLDTASSILNLGVTGSTATASTVNIATSTGATQTINIGSNTTDTAANGTTVLIQGGNTSNAVNIQALASGSINIGSTALNAGTVNVNVGSNNTNGSTTNVVVGSGSSATGGTTTVRAKAAVTITGGAASTWSTTTGTISIQAGTSGGSAGLALTAGPATGAVTAGTVSLQGGAASATAGSNGGAVTITGGAGSSTGAGGVGGSITLTSGSAGGSSANNAGNVNVVLGAATSTGIQGAFQVQNALGANLLTVDSSNTAASLNLIANGGAETGSPPTSYAAQGTGSSVATGTGGDAASGTQSAKVTFGTSANAGVKINFTTAPTASTTVNYVVSFSAKQVSGTAISTTLQVLYSPDNGTTLTATCSNYNTQGLSTTAWTKVTCTFIPGSTAVTTALLIIRQTDAPGVSRVIDIDNVSVVQQNSTGTQNTADLKVGGLVSQGLTLFTLDTYAGTPFTGANTALAGSMYFDTTAAKIQCYDGSSWGACGAAPNTIVTLTPEYAGAVLHGTPSGSDNNVGTLTSDFCGNGGGLSINTGLCASGEARNFYDWTSPQSNAQTYTVYVTYKLPTTFKSFVSSSTTATGRVDNTTNAGVAYAIYKSTGSTITSCSASVNIVGNGSGSANTWVAQAPTTDPSTCSFAASNYIIFTITTTSKSNANAYLENLNFSFSNQ